MEMCAVYIGFTDHEILSGHRWITKLIIRAVVEVLFWEYPVKQSNGVIVMECASDQGLASLNTSPKEPP